MLYVAVVCYFSCCKVLHCVSVIISLFIGIFFNWEVIITYCYFLVYYSLIFSLIFCGSIINVYLFLGPGGASEGPLSPLPPAPGIWLWDLSLCSFPWPWPFLGKSCAASVFREQLRSLSLCEIPGFLRQKTPSLILAAQGLPALIIQHTS